MQTERSLPELTRDFAGQLADLVRNEVRLARAEAVEKVKHMGAGAASIAIGAVFACAAVTVALVGLAYLLAEAMPTWIACLLAAAVGGIVGYLLIKAGQTALSPEQLKRRRTASQVSRDLNMLKERT